MTGESKNKIYFAVAVIGILTGAGILLAIRNKRRIVKFSESLVGQMEIGNNAAFTNEEFQKLMKEVGWDSGDPWCVYFAKLVWYNMAPEWLRPKILKRVSGSSLQTWENLKSDSSFKISAIPQAGDMAIWRRYDNGAATWFGHAGIVKSLGFGTFTTVEGNTNELGGTEGYIVAEKTRPLDFVTKNGLRLIGFVRFA